ncbi:MAG: replication-associated recombination protein A, partial [Butyricicoccus sp.]|nr:replication-associated recombination protein A [Butyricicoccus sp.]
KGYQYAHDSTEKITDMECLPESLRGKRYYVPTEQGSEARAKMRLDAVLQWKKEHKTQS